jgi:trans-2,3-dihydro-3-hydroxyanthranilate isomerase
MGRIRIDLTRFEQAFGGDVRAAAFVFCGEPRERGSAFHARMFAPSFGILEDPATGSAVASFAGYLAAHGGYSDGEHTMRIEQGFEMGRPSLIDLTIRIARGALTGASIEGSAVVVLRGTIDSQ